ncbi:MAG: hypothetical protein P8X81_09970 [Woeseiaceae bacterium]|jgi:hypothetical protein
MNGLARCRLAGVLLGLMVLSGCISMQSLPNTYPLVVSERINVGDKVRIIETNGRETEMQVDAVTDTGLTGAGRHIPYEDMRDIAVRKYDDRKTAKIVGGTILAITLPIALVGLGAAGAGGR